MKYALLFTMMILITPVSSAITCEFSGWDIPEVGPDNTILLDGDVWKATDTNQGDAYVRRIVKEGYEGIQPLVDPTLTPANYVARANDFLERNEEDLRIEQYDALAMVTTVDIPKTVSFLGESQYCYNIPIIGTFQGALEFTDSEIYAIVSRWYAPVVLEDITPDIPPEQIPDSELAILPIDDGYRLIYDVTHKDGAHSYVDADTGEVLAGRTPEMRRDIEVDQQTVAIITFVLLFVGVAVYLVFKYRR
ncbi:hypothetical protein J4464_01535 [Candidatus Woesearchaeota archaeon]|nr:hypothetical protein [Candidatus Woesearchaeota archaeon]